MWLIKCFLACVFLGSATFVQATEKPVLPYGSNTEVGNILELSDTNLYYEIYGAGEPLLIIHGNAGSLKDMATQIAYFSKDHQVIAADSRGHGKSDLGKNTLTYEQITADFIALLDHLELEKINVLGWSDGGIVGLHLAMTYPKRIQKLIAFGANLFAGEPAIYPWLKGPLAAWDSAISAGLNMDPKSAEWQLQRQHHDLLMKMTPITPAMLKKVETPTLIIAADRDAITNYHTVDIFEALPNAHLAIMPGGTHWAPMKQSDLFNGLVSDFLTKPFQRPTTRDEF